MRSEELALAPRARFEVLIIVAASLVGIVARFFPSSPLWLDEALSVNIAQKPAGSITTSILRTSTPEARNDCDFGTYPRDDRVSSILRALASSSYGKDVLCGRLAMASTWRRRLSAMTNSSSANGASGPACDRPGMTSVYQ